MDSQLEKICASAIEDIEDYWEAYGKPVIVSKLRRRFARFLKEENMTMIQIVRNLHKQNRIHMLVTENLTRLAMPFNVWKEMNKQERLHYIQQFNKTNEEPEPEDQNVPVSEFFTKEESNGRVNF